MTQPRASPPRPNSALRFRILLGTSAGNADGVRGVVGDDAREKEGITPIVFILWAGSVRPGARGRAARACGEHPTDNRKSSLLSLRRGGKE